MLAQLIGRAPAVLLLVLCVTLFGAASYIMLPRESAPDVKIPMVMIQTIYTGVAPSDIEGLITIPMENELASVKDLKKMTSTSSEGASIIMMEFEPEVVIDEALQLVRDRVDKAKPKLPSDSEEPAVREISFSDVPIMLVTIAGPVDEVRLKALGEELQDEFTRIPGVLDAKVSGGRDREIRVEIDPLRLAHFGFKLDDVTNAIRNENVNIPGGDVTAGDANYLVRVPGEFERAEDLLNVAVKRKGDRPVFVRDIARVVDDFAPRTTYSRMNGQSAVTVGVTKRAGANIINIADEVKLVTAEKSEAWPAGVEYRVLADQSKQIRDMVADLENNIFTALVLVVAVLMFALGIRTSLFVAIAIPLSMLLSFIAIDTFGMTLNMIVLFSLILALGMLVDNGIVIVENIYRHAELGKDPLTASIDGTKEVAMAVTASTATTVAAFAPMVFWTGLMGQFMGYLPKTVIIVLVGSLLVALIVLPVATSKLMRNVGFRGVLENEEREPERGPILTAYQTLLRASIRRRYLSATIGGLSLVGSFMAYGALNHGTEFFPETEPDRATIAVRAPDGTDLEATDRIVAVVEGLLSQLENIDVYVAETGVSGTGDPMVSTSGSANEARITVDFLKTSNNAKPGEKVRVEPSTATIDALRKTVSTIPGAKITIEKERMGPPVGSPVAVEVAGDDFHQVGLLAQTLRRQIGKEVRGAADLTDDYKVGRPEMTLQIDRGAAKRVGASTQAVAGAVRTAVAGTKASTLRDGEDEYDILVTLDDRYTDNLQEILNLRIPGREDTSPDTFPVPLSAVASYKLNGGSGAIRHIDQDLVVTINGDIAEGFNENAVRGEVQKVLDTWSGPAGYNVRLGGANDEQQDAVVFLMRAFALAVFLIALVLVTQFNSYSRPGIVLATVVLSLIGVLWGLIITGTPFGIMMTGIGVISLAGVVVNNAIVLLDYVEQLRERGLSTFDALVEAGTTRFRPVMLTAITTILGLVPMSLGISFDVRGLRFLFGGSSAQFWGPMANAVIFGLAFATLLTLVMVPTLYSINEDLQALWTAEGRAALRMRIRSHRVVAGAAGLLVAALLGLGVALAPSSASAAPVSLDEALAAALTKNHDVLIARERTIQTKTLRGQALSALSPKVSLDASYIINETETSFDPSEMFPEPDTSGLEAGLGFLPEEDRDALIDGLSGLFNSEETDPVVIQEKQYFRAGVTVRQPLFSGSALPGLLAANRQIDAAGHDEENLRLQVRVGVARAFFSLAVAEQAHALAGAAVQLAEGQQTLANRQVEAGLAPRRAQLQAELTLSSARRDLRQAEEQLEMAREGFATITGLPRDSSPVLPSSFDVPDALEEALQSARQQRPDLQAADQRKLAADLTKQGWILQWVPRVDATFNFSYNPNTGFNDDKTPWYLAFSASWELWDGGARNARIRETASQARVAELQRQKLILSADEEVRISWLRLARTEASITSLDRELAVAQENLKLAEKEFQSGQATWLEVDTARLTLQRAELGKAQGEAERQLAAIALLAATGTL